MTTNYTPSKQLLSPSLLIDTNTIQKNIKKMSEKGAKSNAVFRPHFKTHQSAAIGEMFRQEGVERITVSSVDMAHYFAKNGWEDITIAIPVNLREIDRINDLAAKITLNLLVDSAEAVESLKNSVTNPVNLWIEIDAGYHRSGIPAESTDKISAIAVTIASSERLSFAGILTHFGNSYDARGEEEIRKVYQNGTEKLFRVKEAVLKMGKDCKISIGDTPCCSIIESFPGIDEIRPGNFAFYDLMQYNIGCCRLTDIAAAVACPVIGIYPERKEFVVFGGAVHFSKDYIIDGNERRVFAQAVVRDGNRWSGFLPDVYIRSVSQEHGIVSATDDFLRNIRIGDVVYFIPAHSCLTADLFNYFITMDGTVIPKMVKKTAP